MLKVCCQFRRHKIGFAQLGFANLSECIRKMSFPLPPLPHKYLDLSFHYRPGDDAVSGIRG